MGIAGQHTDTETVLVTKDILLRIKAQILGLTAQDYTTDQAPGRKEQYTGRTEVICRRGIF